MKALAAGLKDRSETGASAGLHLKGLSVWLGSALVGSLTGTVGLNLSASGGWSSTDWRIMFALSLMALVFTVGGAALLSLAYPGLRRTHQRWVVYGLLIVIGIVAGGGPFSIAGSVQLGLIGAGFGALTAIAWCILHRLLFQD